MLPDHDFIAEGKPQAGAFSRRLRGEERIEDAVARLTGSAHAIVANTHLDVAAEIVRGHTDHRLIACDPLPRFLTDGVTGVARHVQKYAAEVLRDDIHHPDVRVVVALD